MKGLLYKDFLVLRKNGAFMLFAYLVFLLVGALGTASDGSVFVFYPCFYVSLTAVTLLSYDEHYKWDEYSRVFPYTTKQIVGSKYLVALILQLCSLVLTSGVKALKMVATNSFSAEELIAFLALSLFVSAVFASFSRPFIFRFGVSKGRLFYYLALGGGMGLSTLIAGLFSEEFSPETAHILSVGAPILWLVLPIVGGLLYVGSFFLSVAFYKKRYG